MSENNASGSMSSPPPPSPTVAQTNHALNGLRLSGDSERSTTSSPPITGLNGHTDDSAEGDLVDRLQRELQRTREEKETLATQYRNLLSKLTTMRNTLGTKLKQDAEELDRQEQLVQQLTAHNEDLSATVETLKEELISSHEEANRYSVELDSLRNRTLHETSQETLRRERELREAQGELERCRMERDEWERAAMHEKAVLEDLKSNTDTSQRELEMLRDTHARHLVELTAEKEKSENLQSVLQDFQAAKDHELRSAVKDYESQLSQAVQSLAEFKHRAHMAEMKLEETSTDSSKTHELEKEVKEKNLLIGKLRHEGVILNEHLMEALRRLRKNSTDNNVDRRLVNNILLTFLATPREDSKRFEMLSLLGTILSWSDSEREKAGLQRTFGTTPPSSSFWSSRPSISSSASSDLQKTDETESFSNLWVEFLLTESNSGDSLPKSNASTPSVTTRRLPSFSSSAATSPTTLSGGMASTPNLLVHPNTRGKEKALGSDSS